MVFVEMCPMVCNIMFKVMAEYKTVLKITTDT